MLPLSTRFRPSVALAVTPLTLTVTVYTDWLTALTVVLVAPVPVVTAAKSVASTPVTGSLNVAVKRAVLEDPPLAVIDCTDGASWSTVSRC